MQTADDDLLSAFRYGSVLRSTIQAANIFRATSGIMTLEGAGMEGAFPKDNKLDYDDKQQVSPFDPEAIVPLPFQLQEIKNRSLGSAVWRRNERERYRVRCVNEAYDTLRDHLPYGEEDKRLSKVETLRLAILYIRHLEMLLADGGHEERCLCFDDFQKTFASQ